MLIPKHTQQGFTLIELMIAITILGIVLALALPSYQAFIQNTRLRNAAESIQNGLQIARAEAVKHNAQVRFSLGAGSSWTVGCVVWTADCPALIQQRTTSEGSSASIIVTPTPTAGVEVIFNSFGAVAATAATFTQLGIDVDTAVLSATDSRDLRITIGLGGNSRMCDPNLPTSDARAC